MLYDDGLWYAYEVSHGLARIVANISAADDFKQTVQRARW
jgi:hypothetical protein